MAPNPEAQQAPTQEQLLSAEQQKQAPRQGHITVETLQANLAATKGEANKSVQDGLFTLEQLEQPDQIQQKPAA